MSQIIALEAEQLRALASLVVGKNGPSQNIEQVVDTSVAMTAEELPFDLMVIPNAVST